MSAPSMVTRTGDSLVIRSVVSGNQLYVDDDKQSSAVAPDNESTNTPIQQSAGDEYLAETDELENSTVNLPQCKVKRNYACNLCNYFTQNPRQHLHHLRDVHNEKVKIYECKDCLYASRHFQKLARHMRIVHDKDDTNNSIVNNLKTSSSIVGTSLRRSRKRSRRPMDEMYEEDYGDSAVFQDDDVNETSSKTITTPNKLKCSLCPFTTRHQGHLTRHEKQDHIKTRFFRCVKCSYVTHIKARFTKHVKYHSMPMIKCDLCDFRTPYKWNLDRHNKNHNGHGIFKCCACNFTADIKQSLTVHEMNHHVPPVGQAAAAGLGVGRRRNKVGASDSNPLTGGSNQNDYLQNNAQLQVLNHSFRVQELKMHNNSSSNNNLVNKPNNSTNSSLLAKKKCQRPIPNLIPIQNTTTIKLISSSSSPMYNNSPLNDSAVLSPINLSQQDINELCAKSVNSSLRDFTSLFDDGNPLINSNSNNKDIVEITAIPSSDPTKSLSPQTIALQKKNASFFDKLKEKLMTLPGDGASLTCQGCGHTAKCLSEIASHQKSCGKCTDVNAQEQLVSNFSSTRCQYCRQRCKSSTDLLIHMQHCNKVMRSDNDEQNKPQEPHPMENKVFVWNNLPENNQSLDDNSSLTDYSASGETTNGAAALLNGLDLTIKVETTENSAAVIPKPLNNPKPITHGTDLDLVSSSNGKRVFKCPHCSFWATTASRFHVHIVGHLNKKPFECSLCSYRSNWRWDITKHIRLKSVRDSAHQKAKVLMTDETGRRNYSKYNKYLIQLKESTNDDSAAATTGITNVVGSNNTDINEINNSRKLQQHMSVVSDEDAQAIFTKLPPGIKVTRSKLCEPNNNDAKLQEISYALSNDVPSLSNSVNKKSLWKCKKCNFRDVDRQVLLQHVKEHYIQQRSIDNRDNTNDQQTSSNNLDTDRDTTENYVGISSGDVGDGVEDIIDKNDNERHCRLKHRGDIRVLTGDTVTAGHNQCTICPFKSDSVQTIKEHLSKHSLKIDAAFKCNICPYYVETKDDLLAHLILHNNLQTENYIDKISMVGVSTENEENEMKKRYKCASCPYVSNSKSQFYYHKQFHRPCGAQFKCNVCSYNVTRRHLLQQHLKIHNVEFKKSDINESPLVWVQLEDKFLKMYKCRQCPETNVQKSLMDDHEKCHQPNLHNCTECSFGTDDSNALTIHSKYHNGSFGIIHCLVDETKTDDEQISQLANILNEFESNKAKLTTNSKKSILFCDNCPARFLHINEFNIHTKFHNTNLPFRCPCCNYTSRQHNYLISHLKVHTEDYQEKTKMLQTIYPTSNEHKKPRTAILMDVPEINGPAWIVVSMNSLNNPMPTTTKTHSEQVAPKKYYRCEQCPAKFHKFPALKYHRKLHGSNNAFKCNSCNYAAKTEVSFLKHQSDHDHIDSDPETSEPSSSTSVTPSKIDRTSSVETNASSSIYVDSQFGILMHGSPEFIYPTYVKNGRVKEKRYKCHKCPSAFEKREQYKTHLTLHGSQQKYCCKQCDYSVKYYANYIQHIRKHQMNEDAHAARQNSSTTDDQSDENIETKNNNDTNNVQQINTVETSTTPLKISVADRQALMILQQRRSKEETSTNDERKPYNCPNCPYANSRRDSIDNHIKRHVSIGGYTSNYTCNYCDYSVPQCHFLREHVKLHFLPAKTNKLELYMMCDKLQIWSQNKTPENLSNESPETSLITKHLIFANDFDDSKNTDIYKPNLVDNEDEKNNLTNNDIDQLNEHVLINPLTGEIVIESNETKDIIISESE